MKVLVATHSYSGNGAAVMLLSVLRHWVHELKWTVDVMLGMDDEVPLDLAEVGANVFASANPRDYDFAIVNTIVSGHLVEQIAPHVPTVLWVHEGETVIWNSQWTAVQWQRFFHLPARTIFQTSWQSESLFKSFLIGIPRNRISCVHNGLPPLPSVTPAPRKDGIRRIVFVGGVYGRKRPQDLIDAVIGLERSDVECVFVGSTAGIETIGERHVAKMREHPHLFRAVGEVDRNAALQFIMSGDVFVLPSGDESQPIAPLEAASLGVPCALTDLPPYAGTWRHGVNCLLNPVGDTDLLRWNIQALLDDKTVRDNVCRGAKALVARLSIASFHQRFDAEMPC